MLARPLPADLQLEPAQVVMVVGPAKAGLERGGVAVVADFVWAERGLEWEL